MHHESSIFTSEKINSHTLRVCQKMPKVGKISEISMKGLQKSLFWAKKDTFRYFFGLENIRKQDFQDKL